MKMMTRRPHKYQSPQKKTIMQDIQPSHGTVMKMMSRRPHRHQTSQKKMIIQDIQPSHPLKMKKVTTTSRSGRESRRRLSPPSPLKRKHEQKWLMKQTPDHRPYQAALGNKRLTMLCCCQ